MAVQEIIMIRTLIRAMRHAHLAMIRANHAKEPNQRNMQLGNLGSSLIIMAAINTAAAFVALVRLTEKIVAHPTYMHVFLTVILGYIIVSGLAGITFGMLLLAMDNPGQYCLLAIVMVWASCVAAAFAIGILLVASFFRS